MENTNGNAQKTKEDKGFDKNDEVNDNFECGWGPWRPRWAQFFNNPKGYLLLLTLLGLLQSMVSFGFVYVAITTIEKRFHLPSTSTGFMVSCYDIASLCVVIFVSYFGEKGNKPAWVAYGSLFCAAGAIIFSLPHFLTGFYDFKVTEIDTCTANRTVSESCDTSLDNSGLSKYLSVFIAGNVLLGIGASPIFTLGVTYMDESVMPAEFGLYMGIFNGAIAVGPAIGALVEGILLNVYTDILVDPNELTISPESPVWIGAWWLPFVVVGGILIITSTFILGFPSKQPGYKERAKNRKSEAQSGSEFQRRQGFANSLRDFPYALFKVIKNIPFMMVTGAACTELFILISLGVFSPKYLESQFNLPVTTAALIQGTIQLIAGLCGSLVSGWVMKRLKLNCHGLLKFTLILVSISALFVLGFLLHCDNLPLAGITVKYNDSSIPIERGEDSHLTATCNTDCNCETAFDPVCGQNNVMYYTACHAGCHKQIEFDGKLTYENCTCVRESAIQVRHDTTQAVGGRCTQRCRWQWLFIVCSLGLVTFIFAGFVPAWTASLSMVFYTIISLAVVLSIQPMWLSFMCVAYSQRAFALGVQKVFYGLLGAIPGPIVYGVFIDKSCLLWEYQCDGSATCWLYDNKSFARSFLIITITVKMLSILFLIVSVVLYKHDKGKDENKGKEAEEEEEENGQGGIVNQNTEFSIEEGNV